VLLDDESLSGVSGLEGMRSGLNLFKPLEGERVGEAEGEYERALDCSSVRKCHAVW